MKLFLTLYKYLNGMYYSEAYLTLSWRKSLSYKNQSNDLLSKSVDWFLYDRDFRHSRVKRSSVFAKKLHERCLPAGLFSFWASFFSSAKYFNPVATTVSLFYPLKTLENDWFSDLFREDRKETLIGNRLMVKSIFKLDVKIEELSQ